MALNDEQETVWIDAKAVGEATEKAVLYEIQGVEHWVPRSQLGARKMKNGEIVRIEITRWWARQAGVRVPAKREITATVPRRDK